MNIRFLSPAQPEAIGRIVVRINNRICKLSEYPVPLAFSTGGEGYGTGITHKYPDRTILEKTTGQTKLREYPVSLAFSVGTGGGVAADSFHYNPKISG